MNNLERIEKIRHAGTAPNTIKAYKTDLKYFWRWVKVAKGFEESYPVDKNLVEDFILDHVEGLPKDIDEKMVALKYKAKPGVHTVSTIVRRIKALNWAHKIKNLPSPLQDPLLKKCLSDAKRVRVRAGYVPKRSRAITKPVLQKMIRKINPQTLKGKQDRAVLEFGFYTGGRRRSEIVSAEYRFLTQLPKGGYEYYQHRKKTDQEGKGSQKILRRQYAKSLSVWLKTANITEGYIFRTIEKGCVTDKPMDVEKVSKIIKEYIEAVGEDPTKFSAHGLRRGFITHCGREGVPVFDVMKLTGHKDIKTAMVYYEQGQLGKNPGTKI